MMVLVKVLGILVVLLILFFAVGAGLVGGVFRALFGGPPKGPAARSGKGDGSGRNGPFDGASGEIEDAEWEEIDEGRNSG